MPDRPPFEKMTTQEYADWCARDEGWNYEPRQVDGLGNQEEYWWKYTISPQHGGRTYSYDHPFPLTLDGAEGSGPACWASVLSRSGCGPP